MNSAYRRILKRADAPSILAIGDIILDRYVFGEAERVSPEAPVVVIRSDATEIRLGGASSVAALLRGMDANVTLCGVVGNDPAAASVRKMCSEDHITTVLLTDDTRPTTTKERILGQADQHTGQQIVRVDVESRDPLSPELTEQLTRVVVDQITENNSGAGNKTPIDAVAICDYGKGTCTPELLSRVIEVARSADIPVLVDPARGVDVNRYSGATLLKLNRAEARKLTGITIHSLADAITAAKSIQDGIPTSCVCVTLDRDGCVLIDAAGLQHRAGTRPRSVSDITGAGDMFLASATLAMVSGLRFENTLSFANTAAGLQVERLGVTPITRAELTVALASETPTERAKRAGTDKRVADETAVSLCSEYRSRNRRIVFTNGCFDLLHAGHVRCLQESADLGDVLFVAINSDESVRRLKGPDRPVYHEADRVALLSALSCVGHVLVFEDETPHRLLELLKPDVLVKGGAYSLDEVAGRELVDAYGGTVAVTGHVDGLSTTALVSNIREATCT